LNNKIVPTKRISAIFLAIVLVTGTFALSSSLSSFMITVAGTAQAQPYSYDVRMDYRHNSYEPTSEYPPEYTDRNSYYNSYEPPTAEGYGNDNNYQKLYEKDSISSKKSVSINKLKCINTNININGENAGNVNIGNKGQAADAVNGKGYLGAYSSDGSGYDGNGGYYDNGYDNNKQEKGFDCVINNNNNNTNINLGGGGGNQTVPPEPEPQTGSLTVNKEIYGCNIFQLGNMNCQTLQNDSPQWILCNDPIFNLDPICSALTEDFFDIEVLDDQGNQIQEFEGSTQGTTIPNLQLGTYTINEIKHATDQNQLGVNATIQQECINAGFADGGRLVIPDGIFTYSICFEYEDEQGNDCSTLTLAANEDKTCTVKNYIRQGTFEEPPA
jgi:hypothetical protein